MMWVHFFPPRKNLVYAGKVVFLSDLLVIIKRLEITRLFSPFFHIQMISLYLKAKLNQWLLGVFLFLFLLLKSVIK